VEHEFKNSTAPAAPEAMAKASVRFCFISDFEPFRDGDFSEQPDL
jgi:hypothetical protein